MKTIVFVLAVLVVGATPCVAREKVPIYLGYCYFMPTASSTRDAFGRAWPQFTVGRLETKYPDKWVGTWDLASFRRNDDHDATMLALTVGVRHGIGSYATEDVQPYVALRAGPYYGKVNAADGSNDSDSRIGLNANASVGVLIKKRYFLESRYDYFGRVGGFQLDGFSVWGGVKILDL